jgi:hypothetical protein
MAQFTLFVHAGPGKTGTSAIQRALETCSKHQEKLKLWYLGSILNFAPVKRHQWQELSLRGIDILGDDTTRNLICHEAPEILSESIRILQSQGYISAVWVNESLYGREEPACRILEALLEKEPHLKIKVVFYLRNHCSWIRSAYTQWGIKHKHYLGPVRTFDEYSKKKVQFYPSAMRWSDSKIDLILRSFDNTDNVISDFFNVINIHCDIDDIRKENESPGDAIAVLWALYNSRFPDETVLPNRFERILKQMDLHLVQSAIPLPKEFFPSPGSLERVARDSETDLQALNNLLKDLGLHDLQIELNKDCKDNNDTELVWQVTAVLANMVFKLNERIEFLEQEIKK